MFVSVSQVQEGRSTREEPGRVNLGGTNPAQDETRDGSKNGSARHLPAVGPTVTNPPALGSIPQRSPPPACNRQRRATAAVNQKPPPNTRTTTG